MFPVHRCRHTSPTSRQQALRPGVTSAIAAASKAAADVQLVHGDVISVGALQLTCLATPGHTDGCISFYLAPGGEGRLGVVFTGGVGGSGGVLGEWEWG